MDSPFRKNVDQKLADDHSMLPAIPDSASNWQYSNSVSTNNIGSFHATDGPCDEMECDQLIALLSAKPHASGPYEIFFHEHWCADEIIPRCYINGPRRILALSPRRLGRFFSSIHKRRYYKRFRSPAL